MVFPSKFNGRHFTSSFILNYPAGSGQGLIAWLVKAYCRPLLPDVGFSAAGRLKNEHPSVKDPSPCLIQHRWFTENYSSCPTTVP